MKNALNIRNTVFTLFALLLFSTNAFTAEWESMESGTTEPLKDVWGSSYDDVFAVGSSGVIIHYNGSDWVKMNSGISTNLQGVWGSSPTNVFAVGEGGIILKYNGSAWSKLNSGTSYNLKAVWGSSGSDVFVVGESGTILNCDESSCSKVPTLISTSYNDVWGSSGSNIFAVGGGGTIYHNDGTGWYEIEDIDVNETLNSVWGSSASNIFAVGSNMDTILHYGGSSWSEIPVIKRNYYAVGGLSTNIYVLAENGKISKYSSGRWVDETSGTTENLYGIWISSQDDAFVVGAKGTIILKSTHLSAENTAPTASFFVSPTSGDTDTTFFVDASECSDAQDSTDILEVRWDWENDGTWDTQYSTAKIASHQYSTDDTYVIKLEVKDSGDLTDYTTNTVQVGEVDGEDDDRGCPIAKLLGEEDPRLETLREFRDQVLEQSQMGKLFIKFYYSQEDKINGLIDSNPAIAIFAKGVLETIIPVIESFVEKAE